LDDRFLFFTIPDVFFGAILPTISTASVMILMHVPALSGFLFRSNGFMEGGMHAWNHQHETVYAVIRSYIPLLLFVVKTTIEGGLRKHLPGMYYNAIPCTIRRESEKRDVEKEGRRGRDALRKGVPSKMGSLKRWKTDKQKNGRQNDDHVMSQFVSCEDARADSGEMFSPMCPVFVRCLTDL
jgi:hypothetical protein